MPGTVRITGAGSGNGAGDRAFPAEVATPHPAKRPGFDTSIMDAMIHPGDMARTAPYVAAILTGHGVAVPLDEGAGCIVQFVPA